MKKEKIFKFLKDALYSYIWLAVLMFVIDIVSKNLVVHYLIEGQSVPLIPGFLNITYQVNYNFAFSGSFNLPPLAVRIIYCVIAPIGIGVILYFYIRHYQRNTKIIRACLMLMLVGALGNLIDRIFYTPEYLGSTYNGVVDWIDFRGIWNYVFNWADSCLVVGTFTLVIYLIVREIINWNRKRKIEDKIADENGAVLSKDEKEKQELYTKEENSEEDKSIRKSK